MSDQQTLASNPLAAPQGPRYRGAEGAATYAGFIIVLMLLLAAAAGVLFLVLFRDPRPAGWIAGRLALFGVTAGLAAGLSRLLAGAEFDRLWSLRFFRGDYGGMTGLLAGLILAGGLAASRETEDGGDRPLAVGQPLEIAGPTLDGGHFDLAQLRGKVVLVDFWATWCGPCVAELPTLLEVYQKYHDDGFEVVGVSFDHERAQLEKFVEARGVPWRQIFFDNSKEQGFENPLGRKYGINAIPRMLLVDREGRLANRGVRGREIEPAVADLLGKQVPWTERVLAGGQRVLFWLVYGVMQAPWWSLLAAGVGAAGVGALAEAGWRRAVGGPRSPVPPGLSEAAPAPPSGTT